jgi:hypothetical protein
METPLQKIQRLENKINEHEEILKRLRLERDRVLQECSHSWEDTIPAHIS